jgi:malonate transporter and related proteins
LSLQILTIIVPIIFVLLLGYAAGRAKNFDSDQVAGINELVLDFALPASLFVGTVSTPRRCCKKLLFRHTLGIAAMQTLVVNVTASPFFGSAVLRPLYGAKSAVAISMIALIQNIILVPATLVLLGISQQPAESGTNSSTGSLVGSALVNAIKTPLVWAPLVGIALVLVGMSVPSVVDSTGKWW